MRLLLLAVIVPALFAVDGKVMNRTLDKPQPGATVTLYKLAQQEGMVAVESVKSGPGGTFRIDKPTNGPHLLQTAYDGVTYNHMLPPASPSSNLTLDVFNASARQAGAKATNHMMLLEPGGDKMDVRESYFFANTGLTTWNDPDHGTLRFQLPAEPLGPIIVSAQAPQGMPIRRAATKGKAPGEMMVDFPIKPGETRIDLSYSIPFSDPGQFKTKFLVKAAESMIAVPNGVTVQGDGLEDKGKEPRTQASIYEVKKDAVDLRITGHGDLQQPAEASEGPEISEIPAKIHQRLYLILGLAFAALAAGFLVLYRANTDKSKA